MNYDRAIVGVGLAGLSLIDRWCARGELRPDERVALIDPNPEAIVHKSYGLWLDTREGQARWAQLLARLPDAHRWSRIRVRNASIGSEPLDLAPWVYLQVPGRAIWEQLRRSIEGDGRFEWVRDGVERLHSSPRHCAIELASGRVLTSSRVYHSLTEGEPELRQHFFGLEIETEHECFDPSVADLMDFRVPASRPPAGQDARPEVLSDVRFFYVLPYSSRRALVEFTLFSPALLPEAEYRAAIEDYLSVTRPVGRYRVLREERGVIPMSGGLLPRFVDPPGVHRIQPIGAASGRVKPSTGYSFARNLRDLDDLSSGAARLSASHARFEFYDRILVDVILGREQESRLSLGELFPTMFAEQPVSRVLRFLDEQSTLLEEGRIIARYPWAPFVRSWVVYAPFVPALVLALVLPQWAAWVLVATGVATIGMAHGALDQWHALGPAGSRAASGANARFRLRDIAGFLLKYWGVMALALALGVLAPSALLAAFVAVSAWHFGETEYARSLATEARALASSPGTPRARAWHMRLVSVVWGAAITLYPLIVHWDEARPIIEGYCSALQAVGLWVGIGGLRSPSWNALAEWVEGVRLPLAAGLGLSSLVAASLRDSYERWTHRRPTSGRIMTGVLLAALSLLPLMLGFLLFFAYWHAWDSLRHQLERYGLSARQYFGHARTYLCGGWVVLLALVGALALLRPDLMRSRAELWGAGLMGLSLLTLPHAGVMTRFYRRRGGRDSNAS